MTHPRNLIVMALLLSGFVLTAPGPAAAANLEWQPLPDLPDALGVAGPFVGVDGDALIVAGGTNFPTAGDEDIWEAEKVWHDKARVLVRDDEDYTWHEGFELSRPLGHGASASTRFGLVCIGGEDGEQTHDDVFLLRWDGEAGELRQTPLPPLPEPLAFADAAVIDDVVYVAGGQRTVNIDSATAAFYRIDLSSLNQPDASPRWERLPDVPGGARAFPTVVAQHNGFDTCIYVLSGRRANPDPDAAMNIEALTDVHAFNPRTMTWRRRADLPEPRMAGTAVAAGQSHIYVLSGDHGRLWTQTDQLRDDHPGFDQTSWVYHTITDTWIEGPATPANQVATPAVVWGDDMVVAAGEVRPRHRTTAVWRITTERSEVSFGAINFTVLAVYLAAMLGVGVYFARRSSDTNDFFRGGQRVPWWVAGMSIYATMLSSITFMAIPAKAFAQDWVYLLGNMMILAVAPLAVFVALPFFRRIDATSAYEYLQRRFNLATRLFGSASFTAFHVLRMAIVMSLASLALTTVTPMTAAHCVLLIGLLSAAYTTLGGVSAVVWTDALQTVVLLSGAIVCTALMFAGASGGFGESLTTAWEHDKLRLANWHWDWHAANLALWVVVLGAMGQNIASYTSDQAVVQRYMSTSTHQRAAGAIWTNAFIVVPGSVLFFAMGTGLYLFYRSNPEKLDPTYSTDQILPLFIANELPVGLAGLVVAGIFAAAQSTVSTSMNSTATTVVTDFIRPLNLVHTERGYLRAARAMTLLLATAGTLLGLMFVDPAIRSLWDQFIGVIGLFMGVVGGLFLLGMLTRRANGIGAIGGAACSAMVMVATWQFTEVQGFLYAFIGITTCFVIGYLLSRLTPSPPDTAIDGLTVYSLKPRDETVHV